MLKRILAGIGIVVIIVLAFKYCEFKKDDDSTIDYNTNLIQQRNFECWKISGYRRAFFRSTDL